MSTIYSDDVQLDTTVEVAGVKLALPATASVTEEPDRPEGTVAQIRFSDASVPLAGSMAITQPLAEILPAEDALARALAALAGRGPVSEVGRGGDDHSTVVEVVAGEDPRRVVLAAASRPDGTVVSVMVMTPEPEADRLRPLLVEVARSAGG